MWHNIYVDDGMAVSQQIIRKILRNSPNMFMVD